MNGPLRIVSLLVVGILATACRTNRYGKSIGRPVHEGVTVTGDTGELAIVEVYPASTGAFVEIENTSDTTIDLASFTITTFTTLPATVPDPNTGNPVANTDPKLPHPVSVSGSIAPGARLAIPFDDATTLKLVDTTVANPAQSGEVYLRNADSAVVATFAWGSSPSAGGLTSVIEVPFPRPAATSIVSDSDHVGCSLPTPDAGAGDDACPVGAQVLMLDEVYGQKSATDASWMVIENAGTDTLDVTGLRFCHDETCGVLLRKANGDLVTIAAGASLSVCLGAKADTRCDATISATSAIQPIAEVFVAVPGSGTNVSSSGLIDYMRTKLAATTFEAQAVTLGYWAVDAAPTPTFVPGESASRNPGTVAPPVWFPALATLTTTNLVIDRATLWNSCAEPADLSAPAPDVVVTSLARASGEVRLANLGGAPVDLATLRVAVDDTELLANGVALTGTLAVGATRDLTAAVNEAGKLSVSVRSSGDLIQFAQWGAAASGVTAAVEDNVWPAGTCVAPRLATGGILTLRDVTLSRGSGGYSE